MKRWLAMALAVCMVLLCIPAMPLMVGAATQTTYAVEALSFTAGYASTTDGELDLSDVQAYDAAEIHNLQYTSDYTELASASGIPYQVFDVDLAGKTSGDVVIHYSGATKDGERVAVRAYNVTTAAWDTLGTFIGTGEVSATINAATYNDGGVAHVAAVLDYETNGSNSMIWSTDPQHYTKFEDLHEYYYTIYQYAASEYVKGNVGYILTTGDLVDDLPQTRQAAYQWGVADRAMSYVEAVGMPNGLVSGNHDVGTFNALDYSAGDAPVDYSMFAKTFPASRYENERWYGGSLNNNTSHYDLITIGNVDFLVMFLGYGVEATDETIVWANEVLKTYSHRTAIIATHEYLDALNAEYNNRGQLMFDAIVDPNPNVKMVVCGHDDGSLCRETVASDGRVVYELLADYQFVEAEDPSFYANEHYIGKVSGCCGDGYIRKLTVNGDTLSSITYSPVTGRYNPYGDVENVTIDLNCGTPDRTMATSTFSAVVLGGTTDSDDVDRITVTTDGENTVYSAVTYAAVPTAPAKSDATNWPDTTYGAAATPSNPFYAHAAKEAPDVAYKTDVLEACDLGKHPVSNGISQIGNYSLNLQVNLNKTPYLYYSFAQPADSMFSFAFINDMATAPWITFLDARQGGATLSYGADNWDTAGGQQYFTTGVTGCVDMRTLVTVEGATTWVVEQLNLYSMGYKDTVVSYLFFGSEPLDLIGSEYGPAATPTVPYAPHAAANPPVVEHKTNLIRAVHLNDNAFIWGSGNYGDYALHLEVDLNKTPYLYYSFAQKEGSKFTFALINDMTNAPWIVFLDARNGGATLSTGNANWDAAAGAQYFEGSATGCIDMRQYQNDKNAQKWIVEQLNLYDPNNKTITINYLFFGSAAIGGAATDAAALDNLIVKAEGTATDGMTSDSINVLKSAIAAAKCTDRNDASALARTYTNLSQALGALTPVKTTEVDASGLVSVKNYSMNPANWLCTATGKAANASTSHVAAQTTSTGMRLRRSSAATTTWPSIAIYDNYTVKPRGGLYLKLDADMHTAWTIAFTVVQDNKPEVRVRLNAGIVNAFHSPLADGYAATLQNIYDVSDIFRECGVDPTAIFTVTSISLTTVGSGSGWNYYNHLELLTGPDPGVNTYSALESLIAYADYINGAQYTSASWATFRDALSQAKTTMSTGSLSQYRINLATHRLETAIDNLQLQTFYEPHGSLLADNTTTWHHYNNPIAVWRSSNRNTVVENLNGTWSYADYLYTTPKRITLDDHQLEVHISVADAVNILLLADGEWVSISKYITDNLNGEDIRSGDYNVKIPLTTMFGTDKPTVVLEGIRVWSVGPVGGNAIYIKRIAIDDLDTYTFDNTLSDYGAAATPSNPVYHHAAKNGPTVSHKVDVLAACGLDHPTVNSYTSYGMQEMHLTIDLTKTPYLYYSIVQADDSKATFAFINDNTYVPFLTFVDANLNGGMNTGSATWDAYTDQSQYVTGSITGCIDVRPLLKDATCTEWRINNVTLYALTNSGVTFNYIYFGSAPFDDGYEEESVLRGDVNFDGKINTRDARMVLLELADSEQAFLKNLQMMAADYDEDSLVNTLDVRNILLKALLK